MHIPLGLSPGKYSGASNPLSIESPCPNMMPPLFSTVSGIMSGSFSLMAARYGSRLSQLSPISTPYFSFRSSRTITPVVCAK